MPNPPVPQSPATDAVLQDFLRSALGEHSVVAYHCLQRLWGGQGELMRLVIDSDERDTVIIKSIVPDARARHPRGWQGRLGQQRKSRSYAVECHWYREYAARCTSACAVPQLLALQSDDSRTLLMIEDLQPHFPILLQQATVQDVSACLRWLAAFHARFLLSPGDGLWDRGSYWHLGTRPEEWQAMPEGQLKQAAHWVDERLRACQHQTLLHGDAKLANFLFSADRQQVAAVDFQYVGPGCGISDVVCLLSSCLSEADCRRHEDELIDRYFQHLAQSVAEGVQRTRSPDLVQCCESTGGVQGIDESDLRQLENEWRSLLPLAWADYHRFLQGWMPTHVRMNAHMKRHTRQALEQWAREEQHDGCKSNT